MNFEERAVSFSCQNSWLYGVLSLPEQSASRGVLIVVGGPQTRVGSHRQFTLLARHLAANGIPAMRFDYRGMGDSEGDARTFEAIEDDLRSAIDQFTLAAPQVQSVTIWGLCDAASAALFYAWQDPRVTGLVLLNPWVRTEAGLAQATIKHYYFARILEREFWGKVFGGKMNYIAAARSFFKQLSGAFFQQKKAAIAISDTGNGYVYDPLDLPDRMFNALAKFNGKVLLIISGQDLTAQEFSDLVGTSRKWQELLSSPRIKRLDLPPANHTFSRREWRDQVAAWTSEWVRVL